MYYVIIKFQEIVKQNSVQRPICLSRRKKKIYTDIMDTTTTSIVSRMSYVWENGGVCQGTERLPSFKTKKKNSLPFPRQLRKIIFRVTFPALSQASSLKQIRARCQSLATYFSNLFLLLIDHLSSIPHYRGTTPLLERFSVQYAFIYPRILLFTQYQMISITRSDFSTF